MMPEATGAATDILMTPALQMGAFGLCVTLVTLIGFLARTHRDVTVNLRQSFEENVDRVLHSHRELYDRLMDHHSRQEEAYFRAQSQTIEHNTQVCGEVAGLLRSVERRLEAYRDSRGASDRGGG
jgi:hypothetical protein